MARSTNESLQRAEEERENQRVHDQIRDLTLRARRQERLTLPLPERLARALTQAATLSDGFSGSYEAQGARQVPSSTPPRPVESVGDVYRRRIALLIRNFEDEIDAARLRVYGHTQTKEERVKRLLSKDYEGLHAEEVAFIDPTLGSVLSIRKERYAAGRDHLGRVKV